MMPTRSLITETYGHKNALIIERATCWQNVTINRECPRASVLTHSIYSHPGFPKLRNPKSWNRRMARELEINVSC